MTSAPDPALLEQIKTILRRDLKLGPTAEIADDMPLMGGVSDFDSLDILMLVSSLEKQFGIKIPNEAVGRKLFSDVATLTRFVQEHRGNGQAGSPQPVKSAEPDWLAVLPHGPEFRYISKVTQVIPGSKASGVWSVQGNEPFFKGHFPNHPIVPGVLITEALAQIAGLASSDGKPGRGGMLVQVDVRFDSPVVPPAQVILQADVGRTMGSLWLCRVQALVGEKVVARGTITLQLSQR